MLIDGGLLGSALIDGWLLIEGKSDGAAGALVGSPSVGAEVTAEGSTLLVGSSLGWSLIVGSNNGFRISNGFKVGRRGVGRGYGA